MNPALLLAHFDRMADTPDAIPRQLLAEVMLDNQMLREVAQKKW